MITLYLYIFFNIILEFFPVSSSGHALLMQTCMDYFGYMFSVPFDIDICNYLLHGPTFCISFLFFRKRCMFLCYLLKKKPKTFFKLFYFGFIVELITVFFYLLIIPIIGPHIPLWVGFLTTMLLLYSLQFCPVGMISQTICPFKGLLLGCAQGISLLAGISRFGSTLVMGRWLGFSTYKAFELSFLIEAPISFAAFCKGASKLSWSNYVNLLNLPLVLTMLIASFCALYALQWVQQLVVKNILWKISYYICFVSLVTYFFIRKTYVL